MSEMEPHPAYRDRYPCPACGRGYLDCADGALSGLMCCKDCNHAERWAKGAAAYSRAEYDDMWARVGGRPKDQP